MSLDAQQSVDALLAEAADWHVRIDGGTADAEDFERWRQADPRHAAAFVRISGTEEQVRRLRGPILEAERARRDNQRLASRRGFMAAGVGGAAALALGTGYFTGLGGKRTTAETVVGGRETHELAVGTELDVNTNSKVEWLFNKTERSLWLRRGEIALAVASSAIPISLYAAGKRVVLSSGRLNARLRNDALDLLMLEGVSLIEPEREIASRSKSRPPVQIKGGEAVLASATGMRVRTMASSDIRFVTSWPSGQLFFSGETLGTAVEEYNRYLTNKISIGDPSLQGIQLGGRFSSHDPADFLASLHAAFGINVLRDKNGDVILTR